jgi:hypothetical protein
MTKCSSRYNIAMPTLTVEIINAAILGFEEQKRQLDGKIAELRRLLPGTTPKAEPVKRTKRKMSAAGRKAISEAQRKRWAKRKVNQRGHPRKPRNPSAS